MKRVVSILCAAAMLLAMSSLPAGAAGSGEKSWQSSNIFLFSDQAARWLQSGLKNQNQFARTGAAILYCLLWPGARLVRWGWELYLCAVGSRVKYNTHSTGGNGSLAGVDALGRQTLSAGQSGKQVGLFYFLWVGEHTKTGPYNNTEIIARDPEAFRSMEAWEAAGGGGFGVYHHWDEPLFGYYSNRDQWVYRRHCQMLTDAGVDFLVFDTTNAVIYEEALRIMLPVWYEYLEAGWSVPKLSFYTNTQSGDTMNRIYDAFYNNAQLKAEYPRLDELWYRWDGRPMIVGNPEDPALRADVRKYFRIKRCQWPNEKKHADGFPWMEFGRHMSPGALFGRRGRQSVMSVSAAQHNDTVCFSVTAWFGGNDRTRSWHSGRNDPDPAAMLRGANFAESWGYARKMNPDIVFVTGFNEWWAGNWGPSNGYPVFFVDSADINCSRDIEPGAGILGDNYYMQMADEIRRFKSSEAKKVSGGVSVYYDYENDTVLRDAPGVGAAHYTDNSGRNDIVKMTIERQGADFIFTAQAKGALTPPSGANWMTMFINADGKPGGWEGYDYVIGRETPGLVERSKGGWNWEAAGQADWAVDGNKLTLTVSCALLGNPKSFQFKWADNYTPGDVYSFYTRGDAAPLGRLNFIFS